MDGSAGIASIESPVDEELAALPAPARPRRSPLVALAVIALAAVLIVSLASDLRYFLSSRQPLPLGDAATIRFDAPGSLADNRLVLLRGHPDYRNALLFEPKGDQYRRAFFRMLGTSSRLWVRAEQTSTRSGISGPIVGRLRRFDALPYAQQVRTYYAEKVKSTRLLDLDELKRAVGTGPLASAHDRTGEAIDARSAGDVQVVVDFPDELLVSLSRDQFAVEEDARRELERLGQPVGPARTGNEAFVFPVRILRPAAAPPAAGGAPPAAPAAAPVRDPERDTFIAQLEAKGFGFKLRHESFVTSLAALRAGAADTLSIPALPAHPAFYAVEGDRLVPPPAGERVEIPWRQIDTVQVASPIRIPGDAWVVIEGDAPGDYAYVPALAALLMLFAGFNVWWLIRSLRRR